MKKNVDCWDCTFFSHCKDKPTIALALDQRNRELISKKGGPYSYIQGNRVLKAQDRSFLRIGTMCPSFIMESDYGDNDVMRYLFSLPHNSK